MAKGDKAAARKRELAAEARAAASAATSSKGGSIDTHEAPSGSGRGDEGTITLGSSAAAPSRVVYIGHLPHGFFEKELLGFFSQFGKLTRVRMSRNKKTGAAKHYAFLEFQHADVAAIAADAMDGYFMFKQKISCKVMSADKVHPQLFAGANKVFRNVPWRKIERQRHDKERTPAEHAKRLAAAFKRDRKRADRIAAAGIEYEYEPLASKVPATAKRTTFD